MNLFEIFALDNFLTEYAKDKTFIEIINKMHNNDDDFIVVWQPFEDWPLSDVADLILDMQQALEKRFFIKGNGDLQ
jgi:UDP-2,3-diacylglucosamine pyrophosphatase LpxH